MGIWSLMPDHEANITVTTYQYGLELEPNRIYLVLKEFLWEITSTSQCLLQNIPDMTH